VGTASSNCSRGVFNIGIPQRAVTAIDAAILKIKHQPTGGGDIKKHTAVEPTSAVATVHEW